MNSGKINEVKQFKPVFAFDYISLNNSEFCFDTNLLDGVKEYRRIFDGLKRISTLTYEQISRDRGFHFHEVDFSDTSISESAFKKCIGNSKEHDCPTVYQFKIFEEARILGFMYMGIFYLVMFDRNHRAYKRK